MISTPGAIASRPMMDPAVRTQIAPLATLPPQLWVDYHGTGEPTERRMRPPRDDDHRRPRQGMWTSTYRPETHDSAWIATIRAQVSGGIRMPRPAWLLTPTEARVWEIDDAMAQLDLRIISDDAAGGPLWPQVARVADVAHMTEQGARAYLHLPQRDDGRTALSRARLAAAAAITEHGSGMPLDWWYSESSYWMRWRFSAVERIDDVLIPSTGR